MMIVSEPNQVSDGPASNLNELGFTSGEIALLQIKHFKNADRFTQALWDAITFADANELEKLGTVYPEHVATYRNYKLVPDWYDLLVARVPQRRMSDIMS